MSLREAIAFANVDPRETRTSPSISNVFKTPQTITLTGTQLELSNTSETETITGPKAGVTVSGGGLSRVFQIDEGVTASISGLTITGGNAGQRRRPVQQRRHDHADQLHRQRQLRYRQRRRRCSTMAARLTLTNCTVSGNSAAGDGGGGCISTAARPR